MYQPKTGKPCNCRPGIQRDNCPACEGTGQQVDFKAIRAIADVLTVAQFITDQKIGSSASYADSNPNMPDSDTMRYHWRVTLRRGGRKMSVPFSQGAAHTVPPTTADVLDCLAVDASGFENARGFIDWCSEYGYDTDSRKAEQIYKTVGRQVASLKRFLGPVLYEVLLWNVERL